MKKKQVPQDTGLLDGMKELCYAVDENGHYTTVQSAGWEVKAIALKQTWDVINRDIAVVINEIEQGEASPLAFYMAKNLMDIKLLAEYSGLPKRKIKKHLRKKYFEELDINTLNTYAGLFKITVSELQQIPEKNKQ